MVCLTQEDSDFDVPDDDNDGTGVDYDYGEEYVSSVEAELARLAAKVGNRVVNSIRVGRERYFGDLTIACVCVCV